MKKQHVVLVDPEGKPLGLMEKQEAHIQGALHLAFSIFIFRKSGRDWELLIQQRAFSKYHSPGLWTNTCCSHAEENSPFAMTAEKRLQEEMGFSCLLQFAGSFLYKAPVGNNLIEHELDHVFVGFANPPHILPDPEEAAAWQWISLENLEKWLEKDPSAFTAWFKEAYSYAKKCL